MYDKRIAETFKFRDFFNKVKKWHNEASNNSFSMCNIFDRYSMGFHEGSSSAYADLLHKIQSSTEYIPDFIVNHICEQYKKSIVAESLNYLTVTYQSEPGPDINDEGIRTVQYPYEIPEEYIKYIKEIEELMETII